MQQRTTLQERVRRIPGLRSFFLASVVVFVLGSAISILAWYYDKTQLQNERTERTAVVTDQFERGISERLEIYQEIMKGGVGLFVASDSVNQDEWATYVSQYEIEERYPGISAIGYADFIPGSNIGAYVNGRRAGGLADFAILPAGQRLEYTAVRYVQPLTDGNSSAVGYDMLTDPMLGSAMQAAREHGTPTLSGRRLIASRTGGQVEPGFVLYVPLYNTPLTPATKEERMSRIRGFVFIAIRASGFIERVLAGTESTGELAVELYDGKDGAESEDNLLFRTPDYDEVITASVGSRNVNLMGHDWTYVAKEPADIISEQTARRPSIILWGGMILSFFVAAFLYLLMYSRARNIVVLKEKETQKAKDDLLALASHQLRTPATSVKQYLGMVLEGYAGKVNEQNLAALEKAYSNNERQLEIINQILYVSKADAGRLQLKREQFDLGRLIRDVTEDLGDMFAEKHQKLTYRMPKQRVVVHADKHAMRMVAENMLTNASKYSYSGGNIAIRVRDDGSTASIIVSDDGVGIDPEDFDMLFEKFTRIDNDLSTEAGGSGIGLYVDRALIDLHEGHITVESEIGMGSTFTATIPKRAPRRKRAKLIVRSK